MFKDIFTPCSNDPLKIRRLVALLSALYALFLWPNLLIFYHLAFGMPETMTGELLLYIGTLSAGPVGAYLFAAHKKQTGGGQDG